MHEAQTKPLNIFIYIGDIMDNDESECRYCIPVRVNGSTMNYWQTPDKKEAFQWATRFNELLHNIVMYDDSIGINKFNIEVIDNECDKSILSYGEEHITVGSKRNILRYLKEKLKY